MYIYTPSRFWQKVQEVYPLKAVPYSLFSSTLRKSANFKLKFQYKNPTNTTFGREALDFVIHQKLCTCYVTEYSECFHSRYQKVCKLQTTPVTSALSAAFF